MLEINLGSYPIRISFSFIILPVLFALNLGLVAIIVVGFALFASVLLHEMGHAWTVRRMGGEVQDITLHALGGATSWADPRGRVEGWRRAAVSAAGSGIQIPAALLVWLLANRGFLGRPAQVLLDTPWDVGALGDAARFEQWAVLFFASFVWVGFVFGLFNWLPMGGLDGYHMIEVGYVSLLGPRGTKYAAFTSLIVGGATAYITAKLGFDLLPIFILFIAVQPLLKRR